MARRVPVESKRCSEDELTEEDQRIVSLASLMGYLLRRPFENSLSSPPEEMLLSLYPDSPSHRSPLAQQLSLFASLRSGLQRHLRQTSVGTHDLKEIRSRSRMAIRSTSRILRGGQRRNFCISVSRETLPFHHSKLPTPAKEQVSCAFARTFKARTPRMLNRIR